MPPTLHTLNNGKKVMKLRDNENCRLELVSPRRIKRLPGLWIGASRKGAQKARDFIKKRGYCSPVVLSDSDGCMTLLAGVATFEAYLEEKGTRIPAVIVSTEGEADDLMFALQSAQLGESLDAVSAGAAIVRLIDSYGVSRRRIAETLGKSPAWINRMENLSRKLGVHVQRLVAEGQVSPRSAQEIARLPCDVQTQFAISVVCEYLNKEEVMYLVNRYLNEDVGAEERDRIVNTPKLALPNEPLRRGRLGRDNSDSARLSRAIARCMDDASCLLGLLCRIDASETVVRISDVIALGDSLAALGTRLAAVFPRGKENDGARGGADD
jgi:ParB-like chromosome segregation protein Spo0J